MAMVFALVFVMIGAAGLGWADDVSFNYTVTLKWKDYQWKIENYSAYGWAQGEGCFGGGGDNVHETKEYTQTIPFEQDVTIDLSHSGECVSTDSNHNNATFYDPDGSGWQYFSEQRTLHYAGNLKLKVYAEAFQHGRSCDGGGGSNCTVIIAVTSYEEKTDQQKVVGHQSASVSVMKARQELTRISVPTSQFEDPNAKPPTKGLVRFLPSACTVTSYKPSEIYMSCDQQDDQFVVYAYTKAAIDQKMNPFASIASIRSSGKLGDVVKAVKWKDDEFDTKHDVIEFVGQATDVDGSVVEYRWEADGQFLSDKLSFFYTDLTLGSHTITFKAKDNSGLWSTPVSQKIVDVVKPPVLMVHGLNSDDGIWGDAKSVIQSSYPNVETIDIVPNNEGFPYGAEKVSEKIKEMTERYGIPKVNILAHSMGGLNSRWYIQSPGYRNDVNKLVMLGTPNHGSTLAVIAKLSDVNPFREQDSSDVHGYSFKLLSMYLLPGSLLTLIKDPFNRNNDQLLGLETGTFMLLSYLSGAAGRDLIPGSPALRNLNGNKKDEGYSHDESTDNVRTVYGNRVQYFNIVGDWPSVTHEHFQIPQLVLSQC